MAAKRWTHGSAFGGVTIDCDGTQVAMITVDGRCAYSTALKKARRMVRLLNAGEITLVAEPEPQITVLKRALRLAKPVVASHVETEEYLERKAIRAGHYTPDPGNTHQSAAARALTAIRAAEKTGRRDDPKPAPAEFDGLTKRAPSTIWKEYRDDDDRRGGLCRPEGGY